MIRIGFTGTRQIDRVSKERLAALRKRMFVLTTGHERSERFLHHGDCVGADEYVHKYAEKLKTPVVLHPPCFDHHQAFCQGAAEVKGKKAYLARNRDIVDSVDILLALPKDPSREELRSGTWSTVRYARKKGVPVEVF